MDVAYMVREGRSYEELRYSLRSLVNLPHDRVWVYGGRPSWLSADVIHVPAAQGAVVHANTARITAAIANNRRLSDEFYWCHDDMFVLAPTERVARQWRCTWADWQAGARERRGPYGPEKTAATTEALAAFGKTPTHCYELHTPMVVDRDAMRDMVQAVTTWRPEVLRQVQKRSLYGNWTGYGGEQAADVKLRQTGPGDLDGLAYASSSDDWFSRSGGAGERIRAMFPDPSPYERVPDGIPDAHRLMAGHLAGGRR